MKALSPPLLKRIDESKENKHKSEAANTFT
jgi:hypothetical protein